MNWKFVTRRLASASKGAYVASGLFTSVLFYLFPLVPGLIAMAFFDQLAVDPNASGLWLLVVLLVVAELGRVGALLVAAVAQNALVVGSANRLRRNILGFLLGRELKPRATSGTGETVSRLRNDVDVVAKFVRWTVDPVGQIIVVAVAVVVLANIDVLATVVVCIPLLIILGVVSVFGERIESYRSTSQEAIAEVSETIGEMFGNITAVKVAGAEERLVERFNQVNHLRRRSRVRDLLLEQGLMSVFTNAAQIATAVVLMLMATRVQSDQLSVGELALFVSYMAWLAKVSMMFGAFVANIRRVKVSIARLQTLTPNEPTAMVGGTAEPWMLPPAPIAAEDRLRTLRIEGVTCRYPDTDNGVFDVDLTLTRGTLTVVTGRVGSGKTTLLRAVLGVLPRQAGEVRWNADVVDPVVGLSPPRAGYAPQHPRLFSATLRENLLLGYDADEATLAKALSMARLEPDVEAQPEGLETEIGARGVKLSGGQVRRTAFARMLVRQPELLVIDDLSSALDVVTEKAIWADFARRNDVTRLVVSHRRAALKPADQVVVMKDGRVEAVGTLAEVLEASGEMKYLWDVETTSA